MIRKSLRLPVVAAALLALGATAAQATGDLAMAKKEGKVVWYSSLSLPIAQEICNLFNTKKMGFDCVLHRSGSGKLFKRYIQEAKSNIYTADVFHTSNLGHFVALEKQDQIITYVPKGQISIKELKILPLSAEDAAEMRKPLRKRFREKFGV